MKFWVKERYNPQLGTYYISCGQMSKKEAKANERPVYGENVMHAFDTEEAALAFLKMNNRKKRT